MFTAWLQIKSFKNAEQKQLLESPQKRKKLLRLGKRGVGPIFSPVSETDLTERTVYDLTIGKQISKD